MPRLLLDAEYRVRKTVAPVLRACCERDGLRVYDRMKKIVLEDIEDKFKRPAEKPTEGYEEKAPPVFLHDTEGGHPY